MYNIYNYKGLRPQKCNFVQNFQLLKRDVPTLLLIKKEKSKT